MIFFSVISIVACVFYLQIGCYAFQLEKKSGINQLFMILCISLAIWSFALVYVTDETESIWVVIAAFGRYTYSSIMLHLTLVFTGHHRVCRSAKAAALIYAPSVFLLYKIIFLFRQNNHFPKSAEAFLYVGNYIYPAVFAFAGILILTLWGARTKRLREKKQAGILIFASLCPLLLNLTTPYIFSSLGIENVPPMGHIYCLVTVMGVYYAMFQGRFFIPFPEQHLGEALQEMMDLVIVASEDGRITKINKSAETLLGYTKEQLCGKPLESILQKEVVHNIFAHKESSGIYRLWEVYFMKKNNSRLPVNVTCSFMMDDKTKDSYGLVVVGHDISLLKKLRQEVKKHKEAKEKIQYMAEHDSLTGLASRKYFYQVLQDAVARSADSGEKFAVLFLDLDDLKRINDTYGHEAGDELLCMVGERIKNVIYTKGLAARIGGDEFTLLLYPVIDLEEAKEFADKIQAEVNRPACISGRMVDVGSSMGISIFPDDGKIGSELVRKADQEMYVVKSKKKAG